MLDTYTETARQILGYEKRRKKKPWISKEVLELSNRRKETRKTKTNSDKDRERYREITKEIKKKARKCKETWIEEKCQEAEKATGIVNTGKLFQTAEEICGTIRTKVATVKIKEGRITTKKRSSSDGNSTMRSYIIMGAIHILRTQGGGYLIFDDFAYGCVCRRRGV